MFVEQPFVLGDGISVNNKMILKQLLFYTLFCTVLTLLIMDFFFQVVKARFFELCRFNFMFDLTLYILATHWWMVW